jgi:hypothetical protein
VTRQQLEPASRAAPNTACSVPPRVAPTANRCRCLPTTKRNIRSYPIFDMLDALLYVLDLLCFENSGSAVVLRQLLRLRTQNDEVRINFCFAIKNDSPTPLLKTPFVY